MVSASEEYLFEVAQPAWDQDSGHTRIIHAGRPEVVLLDIGLPKLNGYDAARRIREQPWGRDMTLIALPGWGQEEDRRKSKEAGFDGHIVKPVDPTSLMRLLASLGETPGIGEESRIPR